MKEYFLFLFLLGPGSTNVFEDLLKYESLAQCYLVKKHLEKFYKPRRSAYRLKAKCIDEDERATLEVRTRIKKEMEIR